MYICNTYIICIKCINICLYAIYVLYMDDSKFSILISFARNKISFKGHQVSHPLEVHVIHTPSIL